jgi:hypothetical protein
MHAESALPHDRFRLSVIGTVAGLSAVGGFSYSKGYPGFVENLYWYVTYGSGFVRRGLLGTLAAPFIRDLPPSDVTRLVAELGTIAAGIAIVWIALLCATVLETLPRREGAIWLTVACSWMMGPTLSAWAHIVGLLDVYLMLTVLAAACLFLGRWPLSGLLPCLLGPAIHEGFVFLGLPVLLTISATRPSRRLPPLLGAAVLVVWTAVIWLGTTRHINWPANAPFTPAERDAFAAWQMGQTASHSVSDTLGMYRLHWQRAILAFAYFLVLPAVITAVTVMSLPLPPAGRISAALRIVVGTGITLSILATAYDLERFLVWGQAINFLLCGIEMSGVPRNAWATRWPTRLPWTSLGLCGALAVLIFLSPALDIGFLGVSIYGNSLLVPTALADIEAPARHFYSSLP